MTSALGLAVPELAVERRTKPLPRFRVLLHNDDINTFEHAIGAIIQLTPLTAGEAELRAHEADEQGVTLLLTTHQERAELYVEQFASYSLTVTCEPE